MAIKINFDTANNPEEPTIVLAKRDGDKIGVLEAKEIEITDSLNDASEISFKVYKELDGSVCPIWDDITNFKLVYCVEWNTWFDISVELNESDDTVKTIFGTELGYSELGQIMLYDIEINTEDDIARDDYKKPTIIFDELEHENSLLHRITEKAPHYKFTHVDKTIAKLQRTFSFNDTSIYDAFQDIAEEINCLFLIKTYTDDNGELQRTIEVYDLESNCNKCKHRSEFFDVCPECGSTDVTSGYGEDTTIFVSSDELADDIGFTTDVDSVKNCFKLEAGDDLMTATVRNCNPNGTDYLWYFSDDTKKDMPKELVDKIEAYDKEFKYYQNDYVAMANENDALRKYNELIDKYKKRNENLGKITVPIVGYPSLMQALYDVIDMRLYLKSSMMPSVENIETDAKKEVAKLTTDALSPIAVQSIKSISTTTADNAVLGMARLIVDSRFKTKIETSKIVKGSTYCTWTGKFVVTNYFDDEDTFTGSDVTILINENYVEFVKQKIEKQLAREDDEVDIIGLFDKDLDDFKVELRKYSLSRLKSFYNAAQACLNILIEQGIADNKTWSGQTPNLYDDLYTPYYKKSNAISEEMKVRESEIEIITGIYDKDGDLNQYGIQNYLEEARDCIQEKLDFEKYIGTDMWLDFCAYRREDKYSNDNYISDGLDNKEMFEKAQEFIETATKEIRKSAEMQHSISTDLKNLLVIDKFKPLVDMFEVGNWLRIMVDDKLYKLRLISYNIDYDDIAEIQVEFSDVIKSKGSADDIQSVLDQASSMATSYDTVKHQAEQGKNGNDKINSWVNDGLSLTNSKIVGNADNQDIVWDKHGMLLREYLPITDDYDERQVKIINRGLYVTDDDWLTSRAAIGNFKFYNPKTKELEDSYGVIADKLVGNVVLSEEVGIYNKNNSITMDKDGFCITTNVDGDSPDNIFTIQKEVDQGGGAIVHKKLLYVDKNGNLNINGGINVSDIKYDEDPNGSTLNSAFSKLNVGIDGVTSEVGKIKQTVDSHGVSIEQNASKIKQTAESITTEVANIKTWAGKEFVTGTKYTQDFNNFKWEIQGDVSDAAKTATNYMTYSSSGLNIGYSGTSQNVLINSNSVNIRQGSTILASYKGTEINLGSNSSSSTIYMAGKSVYIEGSNDGKRGKFGNSAGSYFGFGSKGYDTVYGRDNVCVLYSEYNQIHCSYGGHAYGLGRDSSDALLAATVLYEHYSGSNGTIYLRSNGKQDMGIMHIVDIYFRDTGSIPRHCVQRVIEPWGHNTVLFNAVSGVGNLYVNTAIISMTMDSSASSGTITFSPNNGSTTTLNGSGTTVTNSDSSIYITKVVGWR